MNLRGNNHVKPDKTALVLGGGGVLGACYEVGALLALNHLFAGRTVNDFDIYVGTSAGAFVASLLANGLTPAEMVDVMANAHPRLRGLRAEDIFTWNTSGLWRWAARLPLTLLRSAQSSWPPSAAGLFLSMSEAMLPGLFDGAGLERFLADAFQRLGGTNRFNRLRRELYILATDLNSGQRAIFGEDGLAGPAISRAVAASSALPLIYKPVQIGHRLYVDGGLRGNAGLDVAIEHGARLVICLNPLVPYTPAETATADGDGSTAGLTWQALRIMAHAGVHDQIEQLQERHPEVDIVFLEPGCDEAELLTPNIMHYSARARLLRRACQSAEASLARQHGTLTDIFSRHGLISHPPAPLAVPSRLVADEWHASLARIDRTLSQLAK